MSSSNNNNQLENVPNNEDKKSTQTHEETENKLPSESDELIIEKKKLIEKNKENFDKILDNIIQKLHPIIETRKNNFAKDEPFRELNPITQTTYPRRNKIPMYEGSRNIYGRACFT